MPIDFLAETEWVDPDRGRARLPAKKYPHYQAIKPGEREAGEGKAERAQVQAQAQVPVQVQVPIPVQGIGIEIGGEMAITKPELSCAAKLRYNSDDKARCSVCGQVPIVIWRVATDLREALVCDACFGGIVVKQAKERMVRIA